VCVCVCVYVCICVCVCVCVCVSTLMLMMMVVDGNGNYEEVCFVFACRGPMSRRTSTKSAVCGSKMHEIPCLVVVLVLELVLVSLLV
jgi:hypothetical protein